MHWRGCSNNKNGTSRMKKIIEVSILIFLAITTLGLLAHTYLAYFDTMTPVVFHNEPFPVWEEGGNICYQCDHTRYTDVGVEVVRTFRDGIIYSTHPVSATGAPEGRYNKTICFKKPSTLLPGEYIIENELTFKVNQFATRTVISRTQSINIS